MSKPWFITGASRGFGFEITRAALEAGDKVIGGIEEVSDAEARHQYDTNVWSMRRGWQKKRIPGRTSR